MKFKLSWDGLRLELVAGGLILTAAQPMAGLLIVRPSGQEIGRLARFRELDDQFLAEIAQRWYELCPDVPLSWGRELPYVVGRASYISTKLIESLVEMYEAAVRGGLCVCCECKKPYWAYTSTVLYCGGSGCLRQ